MRASVLHPQINFWKWQVYYNNNATIYKKHVIIDLSIKKGLKINQIPLTNNMFQE